MKTLLLYLALAAVAVGQINVVSKGNELSSTPGWISSLEVLNPPLEFLDISSWFHLVDTSVVQKGITCEGASFAYKAPEHVVITVTHEPHVKKLADGKWEITFTP
jgi:hypothetical protein